MTPVYTLQHMMTSVSELKGLNWVSAILGYDTGGKHNIGTVHAHDKLHWVSESLRHLTNLKRQLP